MEGHYNAARRALSNVLAAYPAASDDVRRIFDKLELAHGIAAEIARSVKTGQTQQATILVNFKFDPARDDVTGHMDRLINILGAQARTTEAEVAAHSARPSARRSRSWAAAPWRRCSAHSCSRSS